MFDNDKLFLRKKMLMNERYQIIKKLYTDYIIFIKTKKGTYKTMNIDNDIVKQFDIKNVNCIYLNNLDIEEIKEYDNNKYREYFLKTKLIKIKEVLWKKILK